MATAESSTATQVRTPVVAAARGAVVTFGETTVLHGVDLELRAGQVHALVGQNGAGKSTLVKALIGVNQLSAGTVEFDGTARSWAGPHEARAAGMEIVYQDQPLAAHLTVQENLFLGREETRGGVLLDHEKMRRVTTEVLDQVDADCRPDDLVEDLTPTQRVQISIAAALAARPTVLILDEPTAALGSEESKAVYRLIRAATARGVAVLYISHRLAEITALADQVTVLRDGRVVESAPAAELSIDAMITAMVGDELTALFPERDSDPGDTLLEVRHLRSGSLVTDIDFDVRAGEIVGLAGLVGSGAAETVSALFGDRPSTGQVIIDGAEVSVASQRQAVRGGFAMVPAERRTEAVFPETSLRANITAASLELHSRAGVLDHSAETRTATRVVQDFGVVARGLEQEFSTLSGGNQQKAIVGRWLVRGGRVYLVAEPTAGVDVGARIEIYRHLGALADQGAAVVVSSTDFEELVGICDRILVVRDGRVSQQVDAADTTVEELTTLAAAGSPTDPDQDHRIDEPAGVDHERNDHELRTGSAAVGGRSRRLRWRQVSVPAAMVITLVALAIGSPSLLGVSSIADILTQTATPALLAAALAIALGTGAFDLSVGATAHFVANLCAVAIVAGWPPALAVLVGIAAGAVVGLVNGTIAGVLRVPSFVATLATLFLLVGLTLAVNGGLVTSIPRTSSFLLIGQGWIARTVPVILVWAIVAVALVTLIWRWTPTGSRMRAVGDDAGVAALRGVRTRRSALIGLIISGTLSGLAGVLTASYGSGATANDVSMSLLVSALAAAFLGSALTRGLLFSPVAAAIGALFVTAVGVGLIANGLPDQLLTGVQGLALLFAVLVAVIRRRQLGQVAIF